MDGNGQEGQRQMMDQQQQGGWYGAPPNPYQQHQPQAFKWPGYDQSMHYTQPPMHSFGQPDYYMQHQHYAPPVQHQPQVQHPQQHAHMYAQQEQVWPSNNGWNQLQWNHQGSTGSEEEDWAAKARAWAAAKAAQEAAQEAAQQAQLQAQAQAQVSLQTVIPQQEQSYQDYQLPVSQAINHPSDTQQSSLVPPGQEPTQGFAHDAPSSFRPDGNIYGQDPLPAFVQEDVPPSFGSDGASSAYGQAAHAQVVSSSYSQDVSSSYDQDTAIAAPPGMDQQDQSNQKHSRPSVALALPQSQQLQLPTQVSPPTQSQQFPYQEPVPPPAFEFHQHPQFDYQQPPQEYQQPPPAPYLPPGPIDAAEMNFGGPPVWPPLGSQGIPFPPSMGPGMPGSHPGPQFDHPHHNHHHHSHPMHGHQPPHMFPRPHGAPHGPGFRQAGPPLGGPFGFGGNPPLGQGPGPVFLPDGNGNLGAPDRPKKAPVPSWLREELLKKKTAVGMSTAVVPMSDDFMRVNGSELTTAVPHKIGVSERTRSDSSGMSENDDDEDDTEAARIAAMNQEIKRVLTEVLLKVTDDLFDEIAQEVMDEDDVVVGGQSEKSISSEMSERHEMPRPMSPPSSPAAPAPSAPARVLIAPLKEDRETNEYDDSDSIGSGAPVGNVLGLATYASDDEDPERGQRHHSASTDPEISAEEHKKKDTAEDRSSDHRKRRSLREDPNEDKKAQEEVDGSPLASEEEKMTRDKTEKELEQEKDRRDGGPERRVKETEWEKDRRDGGERKEKVAEQEKDRRDGSGERRDKERIKDREVRVREVGTVKNEKKEQRVESKGRKRSNDDGNSSEQDTRSPRRARHGDIEQVTNDRDLSLRDTVEAEPSGRENKRGISRRHNIDLKEDKQGVPGVRVNQKKTLNSQLELIDQRSSHTVHSQVASAGKDYGKVDAKQERHSRESKVQSRDASSVPNKVQVESTDVIVKKSRDTEDVKKDSDRIKLRARDGEKDHEDKIDRSRERDKVRDKERDREHERSHEKEKSRGLERVADRERSKGDRGRERGRAHERDRRKGDKERNERSRDRRKEIRDNRRSRRRSSSTSSRGRSFSRSPSGSRGSSSGDDRSKSPKQRRQVGRLSKRLSISRSPVRSRRRRPSRSRSRSPPSKFSHRRHSPSPSRDTERHR